MKQILLITTGFAPQNRIGAVRTTKIAKYLIKKGYEVTVITVEVDGNEKIDNTLLSKELDKMNIYRVSKGTIFKKTLSPIRNKLLKEKSATSYKTKRNSTVIGKIKSFITTNGINMYLLIEKLSWEREVESLIKKRLKKKKFDVIISSYPKISAHRIALKLLGSQKETKWIADFRDPLTYESLNSKDVYKKNENIQKFICKNADAVTYVTEEMVNKLSKGFDDKNSFYYLPNGFDEDDLKNIEISNIGIENEFNNTFKISYVGSLYGGKRDLSFVFKIIRDLENYNRISTNKIKFFYAGKEFDILKGQAQKYDLQDILVNMGYITREDALRIQQQSNLIIVNTWNTEKDQGVIPGKIYECFLLKKPTLAITNGTIPNSELGKMVLKAGLGLSFDTMIQKSNYESKIMDFIESLYLSAIENKEYNLLINMDYIERFSYDKITERLIKIIESISSNK
jgi:hypothetical protein